MVRVMIGVSGVFVPEQSSNFEDLTSLHLIRLINWFFNCSAKQKHLFPFDGLKLRKRFMNSSSWI